MELENARQCETQLQKRVHCEEEDPIEYKLNINFNNLGDRRAIDSNVPETPIFTNTGLAANL